MNRRRLMKLLRYGFIAYLVLIFLFGRVYLILGNVEAEPLVQLISYNFGGDLYFNSDKNYQNTIPEDKKQACINNKLGPVPCLGISDYVLERQTFFSACRFYLFEHCVAITADSTLEETPAILNALKSIFSKPCEHLPPQEAIDERKDKHALLAEMAELAKSNPLGGHSIWTDNWMGYENLRGGRYYKCDTHPEKPYDVIIIGLVDQQNQKLVKTIRIK